MVPPDPRTQNPELIALTLMVGVLIMHHRNHRESTEAAAHDIQESCIQDSGSSRAYHIFKLHGTWVAIYLQMRGSIEINIFDNFDSLERESGRKYLILASSPRSDHFNQWR
ncbi:hypothetical protein QAD02_021186 [Eretmocerus hayati]|uniref:Uncharacterized protein n=1 Tax=Eretmocerus hayati TaxID=131215 RepID=A0ACC2PQV1_9HYME|nr:hypothetical protein QAD02_021186 [Eretmocerus hayati]